MEQKKQDEQRNKVNKEKRIVYYSTVYYRK